MYVKYTNNGTFAGFNLFSDGILRDNKSPKTLILELPSGVFPNSQLSLLFHIAQFLKTKKRNFLLDPPRCTEPAHHKTLKKDSSWSCSSIHLSEFTIYIVLHHATRIHNGSTRPFIMLSYLCGGNSAPFLIQHLDFISKCKYF